MGAAGAASDRLYVDDVFSTYLYTGNGTARSINNGIDLAGEGGLVWIKNRENQYQDHALYDTERGAGQTLNSATGGGQFLSTNRLSALNSDGFTVGGDTATNESGKGIVSWTFRKAPGFFDVVTWSGNSTSGRTIAHNLGSVPGMIIVKSTSHTEPWAVWHRTLTAGDTLRLNETDAKATNAGWFTTTQPTSSVFSVGSSTETNATNYNYVAYIFAHDDASFGTDGDESIIKCGSFTTDGSGNATITLGWEPQWVLVKKSSTAAGNTTDDWFLYDTMRGAGVDSAQKLAANTSSAESANSSFRNISATGFNWSGSASVTYIYMAIRRPHKPPEAGTDVFAAATQTGKSGNQGAFRSGFVVDMAIRLSSINAASNRFLSSRMTAPKYMLTNSTAAEDTDSDNKYDFMDGWNNETISSTSKFSWMFKRAPGFMDVVAYTGTGSVRTVSHNLGVAPELMIIKLRNEVNNWAVYYGDNTDYMRLNTTAAGADSSSWWNDTSPTSTEFTVGTDPEVNKSGFNLIAYLFATLPGISKVGSYTGTEETISLDCGFTNGARFVLIKRTDATGNWCLFDSVRGIGVGNDPRILLNTIAAQDTGTNYVHGSSSGFMVTASGGSDLNAIGGTYIFLAIA